MSFVPGPKAFALSLVPLLLSTTFLLGCDANAAPSAAPSAAAAPGSPTPTPIFTPGSTPVPGPSAVAIFTPGSTPVPGPSAAPPATDTTRVDDGQQMVVSSARFYWRLRLPRDWLISKDTAFELQAGNPLKSAFVHLLSQTWAPANRLPNAQAYVNYWKSFPFGSAFPVHADGQQTAQAAVSADKYGGPYLRFDFDDAKHGMRYAQIYASAGGPNSLVVTVSAHSADFDAQRAVLESILNSAELLKE